MIRVRCEKCGQVYPREAGHRCPIDPLSLSKGANDDVQEPPEPFDERKWRRHYMREYMRKKREREKRPKGWLRLVSG